MYSVEGLIDEEERCTGTDTPYICIICRDTSRVTKWTSGIHQDLVATTSNFCLLLSYRHNTILQLTLSGRPSLFVPSIIKIICGGAVGFW